MNKNKNKNNMNVVAVTPQVVKDLTDLGVTVKLSKVPEELRKFGELLVSSTEFANKKSTASKVKMILDTEDFNGYIPGEFLQSLLKDDRASLDKLITNNKIMPNFVNIDVIVNNIDVFGHINILSKLSPVSIKEEDIDMLIEKHPNLITLKMMRMSTGKELCDTLEEVIVKTLELGLTPDMLELNKSEVVSLVPEKQDLFKVIIEYMASDDFKTTEYNFDVARLLMYSAFQLEDKQFVASKQEALSANVPDATKGITAMLIENRCVNDLPTKIKNSLVERSDLELPEFYDVFESVVRDEKTTLTELQNLSHYALVDITTSTKRKDIEDLILGRFTREGLVKLIELGDNDEK